MYERCKKHGIEIKSAALIELPKGWQPGIQEGFAVSNEEWDTIDDEGLQFDKEFSMDPQTAKTSPRSTLFENGKYSHDDVYSPDSKGECALDSESGYAHSEDESARSPFNFADSVPGTPSFSKSGNSPRYSEAGDNFFDSYSRFDSFNMNESNRFSPPHETLTRFNSVSSSMSGFGGHSRGFTSFDDVDPFGSSGPFKVSSETPKKASDNWSSF